MIDVKDVQVLSWQPDRRGQTMLGYLNIHAGRVILRKLTLHEDEQGRYWIGMPRQRRDAHSPFEEIIEFSLPEDWRRFREAVLQATMRFFDEHKEYRPAREEASCA